MVQLRTIKMTLLHRRKEQRGKKREREREREKISAWSPPLLWPFFLSLFFPLSPPLYLLCATIQGRINHEYRPRTDTFSIVSVHRLLVDYGYARSGVRLALRFVAPLPSAASGLNFFSGLAHSRLDNIQQRARLTTSRVG